MVESAHGGALSSSDFEFSITLSPSSKHSAAQLCPADELFYKGQLLPLHLSPRLSLVRTLLLSTSSSSSSSSTSSSETAASRDSNADSLIPDCSDSSRPSSVTEEDTDTASASKRRYFSSFTTRLSSFFRGNKKNPTFAKKMIKKYAEKVKPLYEKLSSLQHKPSQQHKRKTFCLRRTEMLSSSRTHSQPLNGSLRSPYRMKSAAASCPSSMRSSPSHSGLLCSDLLSVPTASSSSMEELQSAIQAAIAHCKSTMAKQKKAMDTGSGFKDDLRVS